MNDATALLSFFGVAVSAVILVVFIIIALKKINTDHSED